MGGSGQFARNVWERMKHKKHVDMDDTATRLERCLTMKRLIFIGIGKTVGVGIYVLIGEATKDAGPSVILAFFVGFVVTLLNGLCFAEYASKNPRTGAQYTYMYETIGEAFAFIIGWTSVIGYTTAFSMAARGWSGYIDSLFSHRIENFTLSHIANWTSHGSPYPEYPDLPAIFIILVVMVVASLGVNFASIVNSLLTAVAAGLLVFITICGFFFANSDNWLKIPGGFFPNGLNGVLKASSSCFYAFQGYEILGISAEETVSPKKDIPRSIVLVLVIVTILYVSVAVSFTLMVPYTAVNTNAPFPGAFEYNSVNWAKYIVEIGPILALTNLCTLELFSLQRLIFSMSEDGLLFRFLSHVNKYTKVPLGPIYMFGPIVIILVLSIDLSNLIGFMVTYAFIQYSLFAAYLIILRYTKPEGEGIDREQTELSKNLKQSSVLCSNVRDCLSVKVLVLIIYISVFILSCLVVIKGASIAQRSLVVIFSVVILGGIVTIATILIWCEEQRGDSRGFLVPLMPVLPVLTMFFNLLMLVSAIDKGSLVASVVLAAVGVMVYMFIVIYDVTRQNMTGASDSDTVKLLQEEDTEENESSL
ncbi:high affinity cationic amino acid transporter 1-like [Mercenaria mercenaria]|uniref:high affinity cationic amino acid transporter 1-like n=1 Tax=Mercenaria mercenaria TaxID=6596 RepID=UPI00234EE7C3|nr:high affinity cationic amino acid transporter 1-like [Mercenaria mercenaria]